MKKIRIPKILKNKYIIILIVYVVWMGFLDRNNLIATIRNKNKLAKLEADRHYYLKEIEETKKSLNDLKNNSRSFEKFARENYFLKKDGEDIFVVDEEKLKK
jgi:cell division protein DivIC